MKREHRVILTRARCLPSQIVASRKLTDIKHRFAETILAALNLGRQRLDRLFPFGLFLQGALFMTYEQIFSARVRQSCRCRYRCNVAQSVKVAMSIGDLRPKISIKQVFGRLPTVGFEASGCSISKACDLRRCATVCFHIFIKGVLVAKPQRLSSLESKLEVSQSGNDREKRPVQHQPVGAQLKAEKLFVPLVAFAITLAHLCNRHVRGYNRKTTCDQGLKLNHHRMDRGLTTPDACGQNSGCDDHQDNDRNGISKCFHDLPRQRTLAPEYCMAPKRAEVPVARRVHITTITTGGVGHE